jgi:hypothetical protein
MHDPILSPLWESEGSSVGAACAAPGLASVEPCRGCGCLIASEPERDYCAECILALVGDDVCRELSDIRARDARAREASL